MLKKEITYVDYNGVQHSEPFYFNLTRAEMVELEMETSGGLSEKIKQINDAKDTSSLIKLFKNLILKAYGEKSDDGKRFIKSEEMSIAFSQTEAFSTLFMELATDPDAAIGFVKGIVPSNASNLELVK